jgi:Domain of unknown function (DUF4274)
MWPMGIKNMTTSIFFGVSSEEIENIRLFKGYQVSSALSEFEKNQQFKNDNITIEQWASVSRNGARALSAVMMAKDNGYSDMSKFSDRSIAKLYAFEFNTNFGFKSLLPPPEVGLVLTMEEIKEIEEWSFRMKSSLQNWPVTPPNVIEPQFDWFENDDSEGILKWLGTQSPDIWHTVALGLNWDYSPEIVLDWIVRQGSCEVATGLHIYVLGNASYWLAISDVRLPSEYDKKMKLMMELIWLRLKEKSFVVGDCKLDSTTSGLIVDLDGNSRPFRCREETLFLDRELVAKVI